MLLNPYTAEGRELLVTIADSNVLQETLGVVGATISDPQNRFREWTVHSLYAPIRGRAVGGIRAKLYDQKGFITFCNQRDLEVLLDVVSPGAYCPWLDEEYVEPGDANWLGLCADEDDLIDDLFDREREARDAYGCWEAPLPDISYVRRVHGGFHDDFEETIVLLWDIARETQVGPDTRFETVINRWRSVERTAPIHREKLWHRIQ